MSQVNRLMDILKDGEWHSNFELFDAVFNSQNGRLAARIWDLKKRGLRIEGKDDDDNPKRYWYRIAPEPELEPVIKFVPYAELWK